MNKPVIIRGGCHTDERGTISFVNDFHFEGVNRFYTIKHPDTSIVRAWQGHTQEAKYYYPVKGSWVVAWVKMDFTLPEDDWKAEYAVIKATDNQMIYLPRGYANGIRALEKDSIITAFSIPGEREEEMLRWDYRRWMDWDNRS